MSIFAIQYVSKLPWKRRRNKNKFSFCCVLVLEKNTVDNISRGSEDKTINREYTASLTSGKQQIMEEKQITRIFMVLFEYSNEIICINKKQ